MVSASRQKCIFLLIIVVSLVVDAESDEFAVQPEVCTREVQIGANQTVWKTTRK